MKFWLPTLSFFLGFSLLQAKTQIIFNADYEYLNISQDPSFYEDKNLKNLYSNNSLKQEVYGSDNPLDHGAVFFTFKTKTDVTAGVDVFADIVCEHRGASYGNRSAENMIVYPQIRLQLDKELCQGVKLSSHFGDKQNFRLNQGLYIFNMNTRSIEQNFRFGDKFSYNFLWVADMVESIGLNTDDFFANSCVFTFGDSACEWKSQVNVALGLCLGDMDQTSDRVKNTWSGGATLSYQDLWEGYFSLGTRDGASRGAAYLLGGNYAKLTAQREVSFNLESRYYEVNFLDGLKNDVDYRDTDADEKANTIGDELFPLSSYGDRFSQFAVFTEYQGYGKFDGESKMLATDVWGVSVCSGWLERFYDFFVSLAIDLNYIKPEVLDGTFYPFVTLKVGYEPFKNNKIAVMMSNKGMNLNKNYPTFYAYKEPFFGLSFSRDLDFN